MTRTVSAAPLRVVDSWCSERDGDTLTITARVGVRAEDPNLRGHFPGLPVFPGVFVIETLCQTMALADAEARPVLRVLGSIRFLAPLLAGDELTLTITAAPLPGGWRVEARGTRLDGATTSKVRAVFDRIEAADA